MKIWLTCSLLLVVATTGCTTKSQARAQARIAYLEGQQQAQGRILDARRTSIRVLGNVRNPEIAWEDGLTLAQTLAAAEYLNRNTPREIIIVRQSGRVPVDPQALLRGEDVPLEPGDTVEIQP